LRLEPLNLDGEILGQRHADRGFKGEMKHAGAGNGFTRERSEREKE
jgi:hypothetical protein